MEFIDIKQAAFILGFGEEPSESDKGKARTVLSYFAVATKEKVVERSPRPAKLYDAEGVRKIAEFHHGFQG